MTKLPEPESAMAALDDQLFKARDRVEVCLWLQKAVPLLLTLPEVCEASINYKLRDWLEESQADVRGKVWAFVQSFWTHAQCPAELRKLLEWN